MTEPPSSVPLFPRGATLAGKYVIEERIGEGGIGEIYAARDENTGARVAIKILRRELGLDATAARRFLREGRLAAKLESPHVTRVHELSIDNSVLFCAFELLEGVDFAALLIRDGPAPIALCVDRIMEALAGIAEAHVNDIVHRDLKPANLFLVETANRQELVKVLDFGVAKALKGGELVHGALTSTTALVGSPLYMSPEHLQSSKNVDVRADIWSIGVVLYEMTTGKLPFDGSSLGALLRSVLEGRPRPPAELRADLPASLSNAIMKCLAHDPDARFASVHELAIVLAPLGTKRSQAALVEIEMHFGSETMKRSAVSSSPSLPVPEPAGAPAERTTAGGAPRKRKRAETAPRPWALVALGVGLLAITFAIGFYLAGR